MVRSQSRAGLQTHAIKQIKAAREARKATSSKRFTSFAPTGSFFHESENLQLTSDFPQQRRQETMNSIGVPAPSSLRIRNRPRKQESPVQSSKTEHSRDQLATTSLARPRLPCKLKCTAA